ncbi:hypothetical protein B5C34_04845 [Pacificimonas flava]|uniref:EamA domain-containing protein n=2 Tax=Pacificimonas TaxID=1960290 RepID=A0A219B3Z8_9SPHN|nr:MULTISPECIES: DMT family transporter [Pacificimonas]MBZ6377454.1 DMT family transporter [Pacificimonas aurantium]OWV32846.1 hypothetical protein B5C34_04845 [Pacificimonas flava]
MMRPATIAYATFGIASLCAMDAAVKLVALQEGALTATWLRYVGGALIFLPLAALMRRPVPGPAGLRIHALRGVLLTLTSLTFFYGISILPLAEAITLAFVAPLLTPPLAAFLIGERLKPRAILAALIGFAGVLVTLQGREESAAASGAHGYAVASILLSALCYSLQSLILRQRAQIDDEISVAALATIVPLAILTPLGLFAAPLPDAGSLVPALAAGAFGSAGIFSLIRAYAQAEAQFVMIFEYTGLIWAALFGWVLFAEMPRPEIFLGAAIIAIGCLLVSRGRRRPAAGKQSAF